MKTSILVVVVASFLVASPAVPAQEVLWATQNGQLRTIIPANQEVQSTVALDPYIVAGASGYVPGTGVYTYKFNAPDSENELVLVEPWSGEATIIGGLGMWFVPGSMVPDPTTGDLYMQINGQHLWRVDAETGASTYAAVFSGDGSSSYVMCIAIDDEGTGWVCNSYGDLYSLDLQTGVLSKIGNLGITLYFWDIFFDSEGTLWGARGGGGAMYTINQETAETTYRFDIGAFDSVLFGCDALNYGLGCAGTNGLVPRLDMDGCPGVGETLTYRLDQGLANAPALVLLGGGRGFLPLPGGCTLLLDPYYGWFAASMNGAGELTLPLIVPPGAAGQTFTMQGAVIDAGAPSGYALSNGVEMQIP